MRAQDRYNDSIWIEDRVKLVKLGGDPLEGATGKLVGASNYCDGMIYWIVELDIIRHEDILGFWTSYVTMPSVCLEKIEDEV